MADRTALAQYVTLRLAERRETPDEFARRIGVNSSGLYKLLRGEYAEPRQTTIDKIAAGFGMTPADLMIAIGKGSATTDPEEVEALALFRLVPSDRRTAAKDMLRGLGPQPIQRRSTTHRKDPSANRLRKAFRKQDADSRDDGNQGNQGGVSSVWNAITRIFTVQPRALVGIHVNS